MNDPATYGGFIDPSHDPFGGDYAAAQNEYNSLTGEWGIYRPERQYDDESSRRDLAKARTDWVKSNKIYETDASGTQTLNKKYKAQEDWVKSLGKEDVSYDPFSSTHFPYDPSKPETVMRAANEENFYLTDANTGRNITDKEGFGYSTGALHPQGELVLLDKSAQGGGGVEQSIRIGDKFYDKIYKDPKTGKITAKSGFYDSKTKSYPTIELTAGQLKAAERIEPNSLWVYKDDAEAAEHFNAMNKGKAQLDADLAKATTLQQKATVIQAFKDKFHGMLPWGYDYSGDRKLDAEESAGKGLTDEQIAQMESRSNATNPKKEGGEIKGYAEGGMINPFDYNYADGGDINPFGNTYAAGGKLLRGPGDGMSDSIPAVINGEEPQRAALADGEFVIPADVVSHLGNGSTEAGSRALYSMMDRIRMARTGRKQQAPEIDPTKFLPE
jgi:hypothetical protein